VLGKGNNDHAIRKVMAKRYWWKEVATSSILFDFCWFQTNKPINFAQFNGAKGSKKMANHFEFNREIGTKSNLLRNLQAYCEVRLCGEINLISRCLEKFFGIVQDYSYHIYFGYVRSLLHNRLPDFLEIL